MSKKTPREKEVERLRNGLFEEVIGVFTSRDFMEIKHGVPAQRIVIRRALDYADLCAREALAFSERKREEEMKNHAAKQDYKKKRMAFVEDLRKGKHDTDGYTGS